MIYFYLEELSFYRLEEDITVPISWAAINPKMATYLGLRKMSSSSGRYYEGDLKIPTGTIIQYYRTLFRIIKTYQRRRIKQPFPYTSSQGFSLKYLHGINITPLIDADVFESSP